MTTAPPQASRPAHEVWLVRHGETEWSAALRHTGRTDLPLTARGERQGALLRTRLERAPFALVMTSPLRRARDTCAIAGYAPVAVEDADLREWHYGDYEGRTSAEIRRERPDWDIWSYGVPNGESVTDVGARVDRVIAQALAAGGNVALFAHAHVLRVLAARWLGEPPAAGRFFPLETASLSILGHEFTRRVIHRWNDVSHLSGESPT